MNSWEPEVSHVTQVWPSPIGSISELREVRPHLTSSSPPPPATAVHQIPPWRVLQCVDTPTLLGLVFLT